MLGQNTISCHLPLKLVCWIADQIVPALRDMQQEPAWPLVMAHHQPQGWQGSLPSLTGCHQDLVYLTTEKALNTKSVQVIHSFYSFMLVRRITAGTDIVSVQFM